jgi:hypothetical protein
VTHRPCHNKGGDAAHYALICGYIVLDQRNLEDNELKGCECDCECECTSQRVNRSTDTGSSESACAEGCCGTGGGGGGGGGGGTGDETDTAPNSSMRRKFLLVAMHGLHSSPVIAPCEDWVASNAQLHCLGKSTVSVSNTSNAWSCASGDEIGSAGDSFKVEGLQPSLKDNFVSVFIKT